MSPTGTNPAGDALVVTKELVATAIEAAIDGSDVGFAAAEFLRENEARLIGVSTAAFGVLVNALQGAKTADDLYQAKAAYVQNLTYDELLAFQETSAEALASHANAQVRASSFFDAVADVGTRIIPKLVPALLKIVA